MTLTFNEVLLQFAAAAQKAENSQAKHEEDDGNGSDASSYPPELNGHDVSGGAVSDDDMKPELGKMKPRRRYKGKKRSSTGRSWVKLEDEHAPRRPRSAYVLFLSTNRSKYGSAKEGPVNQSNINVALASEWQKLVEADRQVYIDRANEERAQYDREMSTYKDTPEYHEFSLKKAVIMKQRKLYRQGGLPMEQLQKSEEAIMRMGIPELEQLQSALKVSGRNVKNSNTATLDMSTTPMVNEIPIFSEAFLNYNRNREAELRAIRRTNRVAEDENRELQEAIARLRPHSEIAEQAAAVKQHFDNMVSAAGAALAAAAFARPASQNNIINIINQAARAPSTDPLVVLVKEALSNVDWANIA
ncbi:unnamed protein product, partial [Mesorhabditis spiculigera]